MRYASNTPERDRPRSAAMKSECDDTVTERLLSSSSETHQPVDIRRRGLADGSRRPAGIAMSIPQGVASHRAPPPSLPGRLPGRIRVEMRADNARHDFDHAAIRQ